MKKVYLGILYDRFGYDLTVVSDTKDGAKKALLKEYEEQYWRINATDPKEDENDWGQTYYEAAEEDIDITEMELGKVEWR